MIEVEIAPVVKLSAITVAKFVIDMVSTRKALLEPSSS